MCPALNFHKTDMYGRAKKVPIKTPVSCVQCGLSVVDKHVLKRHVSSLSHRTETLLCILRDPFAAGPFIGELFYFLLSVCFVASPFDAVPFADLSCRCTGCLLFFFLLALFTKPIILTFALP